MEGLFDRIAGYISSVFIQFGVRDAIDIIIVAFVIYQALMLTKGTRATQVLKGLGVLLIASFAAGVARLQSTAWLLNQVLTAGAVALVVLFQPELRRALEQIGRGRIFERTALFTRQNMDADKVIDEICICMSNLAKRKVGALIVVERMTGLLDIISTGTRIEGIVTAALLENIFEPNTPLHDGAVIVKEGVIVSAGCFLPLSDNNTLSRELGTRHRAALGASEISDCLSLVVSEETGKISYALEGKLSRELQIEQLRQVLKTAYEKPGAERGSGSKRTIKKNGQTGKQE